MRKTKVYKIIHHATIGDQIKTMVKIKTFIVADSEEIAITLFHKLFPNDTIIKTVFKHDVLVKEGES